MKPLPASNPTAPAAVNQVRENLGMPAYLALLTATAKALPGAARLKGSTYVNVFTRWLKLTRRLADPASVVNEELLASLRQDLRQGRFRNQDGRVFSSFARKLATGIRHLHNLAAQSHPDLLAPLAAANQHAHQQRLGGLTPVTQQLLVDFEHSGTRVSKRARHRDEPLAASTRTLAVEELRVLLARLDLTGVEQVTKPMIEGLLTPADPDDSQYRRHARIVHNVAPLFRWAVAKQLLTENPVAGGQQRDL